QQVGQEQQPAQRRHRLLGGGEGHGNDPAEGDAQVDLRQVGVALEEGIGGGEENRGDAQQHRQPVGQQHQAEGHQHHQREDQQRLGSGDFAGGQRPAARAFDMRIQPAVGVIVDDAAGRTGQPDAGAEDEEQLPGRQPFGRQPQRPPGGPEQQQGADRPIAAQQSPVGVQALAPERGGGGGGGGSGLA